MYILSLRANKESFEPIFFNETGLSIVCGSRCDTEEKEATKKDRSKTYNGVGKSLMIRLIDFCLGSSNISDFKKSLPGWEFILEIKLNNSYYIISRKTDEQENIYVNGVPQELDKYTNWLDNETFKANREDVKHLTFRSLITRFIRPTKSSYESYKKTFSRETEFQSLINDGFILGLDVDKIYKKYKLKKDLDKTKTVHSAITDSETLKSNVSKVKDIPLVISRLEKNIHRLKDDLANFKIAENYNDIENKLEELEKEKQVIRNQLFIINKQLEIIKENLKSNIEIEEMEIIDLYKIAEIQISDMIAKKMNEVTSFHKRLIENRHTRLKEDKKNLDKKRKDLENVLSKIDKSINQDYKFLEEHGALSQYNAIQSALNEDKIKLSKITEMQSLLNESEKKITDIKTDLATEDSSAINYIDEISQHINALNDEFEKVTEKLYPEKNAGITIINNTGDNQVRFDLEAEIDDEESDGINSAKLLAYDFVKLINVSPKLNFLIHDGRLFNHMDERQIATILSIISEKSKKIGFQYIMTINENILEGIKDVLTEDEKNNLIKEDTIVRKLFDDSPTSKLLGINVNLKYQ